MVFDGEDGTSTEGASNAANASAQAHDEKGDVMPDIVPFGSGSLLPSRVERQTGRALERIRASQAVATAHEVAKVEVIQDVTEAALMATANVSAIEALLVARTPHAEGRLRTIADAGALGMAEVVMKARRSVS